MLSQEHEIASWKKFRRLWIHLKKTIDKQTKYGGFIDSCDCYHCEKREECCKHKNHGTWKTITMLKQFRRLWIHPRKKKQQTNKQTKYGGFIDNCGCFHFEMWKDCCKHKNHRTWKTITMLTSFQTPQLQSAVSPLQICFPMLFIMLFICHCLSFW